MSYVASYTPELECYRAQTLSSIPDLGSGVKKYTCIYKVKCFKDSVNTFIVLKGIFIRKYSTFDVYINLLNYMPNKVI